MHEQTAENENIKINEIKNHILSQWDWISKVDCLKALKDIYQPHDIVKAYNKIEESHVWDY